MTAMETTTVEVKVVVQVECPEATGRAGADVGWAGRGMEQQRRHWP